MWIYGSDHAEHLGETGNYLNRRILYTNAEQLYLNARLRRDSKEVETEKLKKAPERVDEIVEAIRQKKNPSLYCAGSAPLLKSYMVYPLFTHFAIGSNRFYATDTCISCGICAKVCPTGTISLSGDGKPEWADTCVQCVACIHRLSGACDRIWDDLVEKGTLSSPRV